MVSVMAGPLNGQRCAMNHEALQKEGKPWRRSNHDSASSRPRTNPSKDTLTRIARSTTQLSTQIKYISYLIAYSAAGTPRDADDRGVKDSARRRSGKTSMAGGREEGAASAANMDHTLPSKKEKKKKKGNEVEPETNEKKDEHSANPPPPNNLIPEGDLLEPSYERYLRTVANRPDNRGPGFQPVPKEDRPEDKFKGNDEYPLSDGFLREEYVETFTIRFKCHRRPWKASCLGWFWSDLCRQRRDGKVETDNFMFLIAAVELHEHMMANQEVMKKGALPPRKEQWRDVVDSMAHNIFYGISAVKHITGDENMTFPRFLAFWKSYLEKNDKLGACVRLWH